MFHNQTSWVISKKLNDSKLRRKQEKYLSSTNWFGHVCCICHTDNLFGISQNILYCHLDANLQGRRGWRKETKKVFTSLSNDLRQNRAVVIKFIMSSPLHLNGKRLKNCSNHWYISDHHYINGALKGFLVQQLLCMFSITCRVKLQNQEGQSDVVLWIFPSIYLCAIWRPHLSISNICTCKKVYLEVQNTMKHLNVKHWTWSCGIGLTHIKLLIFSNF